MNQNLNQNQLSYIFKNMDDAVCITGKTGIIYYLNDAANRLLGLDDENSTNKIWEVIPYVEKNDNLIQLFINAITAKERTFQDLVEYEKNDGSVCKLRVSITFLEEESLFVIVINNITEFMRVSSAFKRYTSSSIADYVLNTPGGEMRGGSKRDVSILMSDLRGFTALSTKLAPEVMITILNNYFENMVGVIERYGGTVIEFLGDGIFVVFGAPKDDKEHALHALKCAIEMQNKMEDVNRWNEDNGYPMLEMGIGINSGDVIVGNIGSENKMKYGCMGETVNLAGRVESFTIGGQVIISERTKEHINVYLQIAGKQSFLPKGAKEEMMIYEIKTVDELKLNNSVDEINWLQQTGSTSDKNDTQVSIYEIEGKQVIEVKYPALVTAISVDERYAKLVTEKHLEKSQNIMIDISGDLYAKVMDVNEDFYTICFTSKPDSFSDWAENFK